MSEQRYWRGLWYYVHNFENGTKKYRFLFLKECKANEYDGVINHKTHLLELHWLILYSDASINIRTKPLNFIIPMGIFQKQKNWADDNYYPKSICMFYISSSVTCRWQHVVYLFFNLQCHFFFFLFRLKEPNIQ